MPIPICKFPRRPGKDGNPIRNTTKMAHTKKFPGIPPTASEHGLGLLSTESGGAKADSQLHQSPLKPERKGPSTRPRDGGGGSGLWVGTSPGQIMLGLGARGKRGRGSDRTQEGGTEEDSRHWRSRGNSARIRTTADPNGKPNDCKDGRTPNQRRRKQQHGESA